MNKPIVRLATRNDLPRVTITLEEYEHAMLELALRYLIQRIESHEFAPLEEASVEAFAKMRTALFGIQAKLRTGE